MLKIFFMILILVVSSLYAYSDLKIINGREVSENNTQWKSIVALKWNGDPYCGGTLIAPTWILTAAHCLVNDRGDVYSVEAGDSVGLGSYNINSLIEYVPKRFIVHPSYNPSITDNDIGLVELEKEVIGLAFTTYDTSHSLAENTQTKVAGWGNMSTTSTSYPRNLIEALVPIVDTDICNSAISYDGEITSNMFCAGYMQSTRDSCQGDSGGPLLFEDIIVGIVSWGRGCAQRNFPGVYTKVQNYGEWIKSYVPYVVVQEDKSIEALMATLSILLKN